MTDEFRWVSVVIPVLNAAMTLSTQLEALVAQTYGGAWEVVVADNGSDDGTKRIALSFSHRLPALKVVDASDRRGIGHARNVGAGAARGEFIAFCDGDDVVEPTWLEALVEAGRRCDVVGGHLDYMSLNSAKTRAWRPAPLEDGLPVSLKFLPYAVGANFGVRASVLRALDGWREDLTICGDDIDFSWRAQLECFRLCYARDAVVRYRYRGDPLGTARQFYNYGLMQPGRFREFRRFGVPTNDWKSAIKEWLWILAHAPDLLSTDERRGVWMRKAAYRYGRLVGSIRQRVVYL